MWLSTVKVLCAHYMREMILASWLLSMMHQGNVSLNPKYLSTERRVCDPSHEKQLRWQHHFTVPKNIPDGSALAVCTHFLLKLCHFQ